MYTTVASLALIGLTAARPAPYGYPTTYPGSYPSSYPTSVSSYPPSSTGEVPFSFPSTNGSFPQIVKGSPQLLKIEQQAHGTLSNGSSPGTLQSDSITSLGFIAFNELFEVAFFTELLTNITQNKPGFDDIPNRDEVLANLKVIQAQEELHALNANFAFNAQTGGKTILPCKYIFPVSTFDESIALASTFTDVVLGTLPDIQTLFAKAGSNDSNLIRGVGSVIGQEGEQNGFYRTLLHKVPSALPFLTGSARDFAFSAINQDFVVPNSCPSLDLLTQGGLTIFDILTLETSPADITTDEDSMIEFSFETSKTPSFIEEQLFLTYINQQNVPFSEQVSFSGSKANGAITFTVPFPGKSQEMNGLTIAAITNSTGPFASPDDVAQATLFGPALIEVN